MAPRAEATPVTGKSLRLSPVRLESFDEYTLIARLGAGGMAEVFLGIVDGPLGFRKPFAVKRLHRHMQDDPGIARMFLLEGALAARLTHPNIVQTIKVGEHRGQHFIAMEYLDGQPLNRVHGRVRSQHGRLPPALAVRIASEALDGLDHAHEARDFDGTPLSIVHRDVSPHNLFVTFDGHVKLLDFGIAKASTLESMSRTGLVKGKFGYVAPEQARSELIDRRADVWSMGVTLWESLSGQKLFRGSSDAQLLRAALRDDIPWVNEVAPWVPEELARIVDQALRRDKGARFGTALEFKVALDTWLASHSAESSRLALSATMHALFSDTINHRRETLRTCFARMDAAKLERRSKPVLPEDVEHRSGPLPAPSPVSSPSKPKTHYRVAALVAAVTTAILCAALYASDSSARKPNGPEERATRSPSLPTGPQEGKATAPLPVIPRPAEEQAPVARASAPGAAGIDAKPRAAAFEARATSLEISQTPRSASSRGARKLRAPISSEVASEPVREEAEVQVPKTPGRLRLDSTPYAVVTLNGKRLGITPIDVELPQGTHTLLLKNPEKKIETTYQVSIPAGQSVERRIAIE